MVSVMVRLGQYSFEGGENNYGYCSRNLYNRIFEFTNKHTGYGMELPGQEGFTIIQYNKEDEYQ